MTKLAPCPTIFSAWEDRPPIDNPQEIFEGVPGLEDTDGVNQAKYKSTRTTVEMGGE